MTNPIKLKVDWTDGAVRYIRGSEIAHRDGDEIKPSLGVPPAHVAKMIEGDFCDCESAEAMKVVAGEPPREVSDVMREKREAEQRREAAEAETEAAIAAEQQDRSRRAGPQPPQPPQPPQKAG